MRRKEYNKNPISTFIAPVCPLMTTLIIMTPDPMRLMAFQSPGAERWGSPVTQLMELVPAGWWHDKFPDSCHHPWTTFSHPQPSGGDTTTATEQYIHLSINNEKSIQGNLDKSHHTTISSSGGPGNVLLHPIGRGLLPPLHVSVPSGWWHPFKCVSRTPKTIFLSLSMSLYN